MFCFKFHKIYPNGLFETIVLDIYYSILIYVVYKILIKSIVVNFLNIKAKSKKNLEILNLQVRQKCALDTIKTCDYKQVQLSEKYLSELKMFFSE